MAFLSVMQMKAMITRNVAAQRLANWLPHWGWHRKKVMMTFQSRFGREPWLMPYTDETLKMLGEKGVGHIQVMCPGFAADCLETLEEIAEQNREVFLGAGGKKYEYIPALNATPEHIEMMAQSCCRVSLKLSGKELSAVAKSLVGGFHHP